MICLHSAQDANSHNGTHNDATDTCDEEWRGKVTSAQSPRTKRVLKCCRCHGHSRTRLTKTSRRSRTCVILRRQLDRSHATQRRRRRRGVVAASRRRCGVVASLRQFDGSQSSRRRGLKSTLENGTGRRRGLSNWQLVAVARHAPLWSAPGRCGDRVVH
jgi:hypothetical protein